MQGRGRGKDGKEPKQGDRLWPHFLETSSSGSCPTMRSSD